jgi:hypothetical protein
VSRGSAKNDGSDYIGWPTCNECNPEPRKPGLWVTSLSEAQTSARIMTVRPLAGRAFPPRRSSFWPRARGNLPRISLRSGHSSAHSFGVSRSFWMWAGTTKTTESGRTRPASGHPVLHQPHEARRFGKAAQETEQPRPSFAVNAALLPLGLLTANLLHAASIPLARSWQQ